MSTLRDNASQLTKLSAVLLDAGYDDIAHLISSDRFDFVQTIIDMQKEGLSIDYNSLQEYAFNRLVVDLFGPEARNDFEIQANYLDVNINIINNIEKYLQYPDELSELEECAGTCFPDLEQEMELD